MWMLKLWRRFNCSSFEFVRGNWNVELWFCWRRAIWVLELWIWLRRAIGKLKKEEVNNRTKIKKFWPTMFIQFPSYTPRMYVSANQCNYWSQTKNVQAELHFLGTSNIVPRKWSSERFSSGRAVWMLTFLMSSKHTILLWVASSSLVLWELRFLGWISRFLPI